MLSKGNKRKAHKRHGFLARMKNGSSNVIKRRRQKGRHVLGVR